MTRMTVNGEPIHYLLDPQTPLLWALRDASNLTGTKHGCDSGDCGACTVIVDGRAVASCRTTIASLEGSEVVTIEGLSPNRTHPVRLLRARLHHGHRGAAPVQPEPEPGGDRRDPQHLPLRRLSADPQGDRTSGGVSGVGGARAGRSRAIETVKQRLIWRGAIFDRQGVESTRMIAMPKSVLFLLLATAAVPAMAADENDDRQA